MQLKASLGILFTIGGILQSPIHAQNTEYDENGCKIVQTVSDFDIDAYASKPWYIQQQAKIAYLQEDRFFCVKAEYTVQTLPTFPWLYEVIVNNQARNEFGHLSNAAGLCAYQTGDGENLSKLAVAPCFLPKIIAGPYWVVAYDETEGYALISGGQPTIRADPDDQDAGCRTGEGINNSGLWIFTRSQERDEDLVETVRSIAFDAGFDLSVLENVTQTSCDVCVDSDDEFEAFWGSDIDCEFVGQWPLSLLLCRLYNKNCPSTCNSC